MNFSYANMHGIPFNSSITSFYKNEYFSFNSGNIYSTKQRSGSINAGDLVHAVKSYIINKFIMAFVLPAKYINNSHLYVY